MLFQVAIWLPLLWRFNKKSLDQNLRVDYYVNIERYIDIYYIYIYL